MKKALTIYLFLLIPFLGFSASLTSISPAVSDAGKILIVTITGANTHFSQATSTIKFSQGSNTITTENMLNISDTSIQANITIPANANAGDYDVILSNVQDGNIFLLKGFHVNSVESPVLISISPDTTFVGKTLTVTLAGRNTHFAQASSSINFSQGSSTIIVNSTSIHTINNDTIQAGFTILGNVNPGDYDVNLSNSLDGNISLQKQFHVKGGTSPTLASISPNTSIAGKTLTVTITGTNTHFSQASSSINFSQGSSTIAANSSSINRISNTSIQVDFTIPVNANPGDYDVNLSNGLDGNISLQNGFHVSGGTSPTLASISPNTVLAGKTLTVTITGTNTHFSQASNSINFSQGSSTIAANSTSINAINNDTIQAGFTIPVNANPGDYSVNLSNGLDGNISLQNGFHVSGGTSPMLVSISPNTALVGKTLTVTITGTNTHFSQASSSINFIQGSSTIAANSSSINRISNTSIQVDFTIPVNANPGDYDVNLSNALDGNISLQNGFHVSGGTSPILVSISPNTAIVGKTLTVTITGINTHFSQASSSLNFSQGSSTIYANPTGINRISNTSIQADFTIPADASLGNYTVNFSNLIDGSLSLTEGFQLIKPALVSISPDVAPRNRTLIVSIFGRSTHFTQASNTLNLVRGNNMIVPNANSVNVISDTEIEASFTIASNAILGNYDVNLTNLVDGSLSFIHGFNVRDTPSLTSISPAVSETGKTLTVTITGKNTHFSQATSTVNLSQLSSNTFIHPDFMTILNDSSIQASFNFPLNTSIGDYTVNASNNLDNDISIPNGFHLNQNTSPLLLSINPATALPGQTLTVTITGMLTHFSLEDCTLNLTNGNNTIVAASLTKISDTSVQAHFIIPQNAVIGYYDVHVSNSTDGTLTLTNGFQIGTPALVSISPVTMEAVGNTIIVTISGAFTHFSQASNTISLNQGNNIIPANDHSVSVMSDTSIQAAFTLLPTAALGFYDVHLTNLTDGSLLLTKGVKVVPVLTGNENTRLDDLMVVSPNPVKDSFWFDKLDGKGTLTLYDLNSRVILEKQIIGTEKVIVSDLPNGIYIVRLVTDSGTKIQKVIKQ